MTKFEFIFKEAIKKMASEGDQLLWYVDDEGSGYAIKGRIDEAQCLYIINLAEVYEQIGDDGLKKVLSEVRRYEDVTTLEQEMSRFLNPSNN